jgi:hypothetical protein
MKNLFDGSAAERIKTRIARLAPESQRIWGTMTSAQMMAHCAVGLEQAVGDQKPPRAFLGRIAGTFIKPLLLGNDKPMRRNSPTLKGMAVQDDRDFQTEQQHLSALVDRFVKAGPTGCTTHPHTFFGRMTPTEWATLMYKHLDHHLPQFGV